MTINQIYRRARVKPPAIYYHFGSKEGLLGAVVEGVTEAWLDQVEASQPAGGDIAERLRVAVDGWQAMIEDAARPMKLLLSVQLDGADRSAEIRASLRRVHQRARQRAWPMPHAARAHTLSSVPYRRPAERSVAHRVGLRRGAATARSCTSRGRV